MPILLMKSYERSVKSWVKSKDFEIHTPFSGVDDPSQKRREPLNLQSNIGINYSASMRSRQNYFESSI